jgi:septal ring factor EnvC (AmiA/AmiB activator)
MTDAIDTIISDMRAEFRTVIDAAEEKSSALRAQLVTKKAEADTKNAEVRALVQQIAAIEGDEAKRARKVILAVEAALSGRLGPPHRVV